MDMKDQNTQPLINSARANESDIAIGSTKPTNFSSFDSCMHKEKDDFFMRHSKTSGSDSPVDLGAETPTHKYQICGMRLKTDAPKHAAVPILGLFATQVMATVFMNSQVIFLLRTNMTFMTED